MRSPFPGMGPYLETHWGAIHTLLIAASWRSLNRTLPADLSVSVQGNVEVDADGEPVRRIGPDVFVTQDSDWKAGGDGTILIDAPIRLQLDLDPVIERSLHVTNDDGKLITVIEYLIASNKVRPGSDDFKQKRSELLSAGVHLVEIDLVRAGDWKGLFEPPRIPVNGFSTYRVIVRTATGRRGVFVFPIRLPDPLPDVPVPLRADDPKVFLPLQQMIDTIYTDGRYGRTLKYDRPLDPPLWPDEAAYAAGCLAGRANH